jgi:dCTP deaminase
MILTAQQIEEAQAAGDITIDPFELGQIQAASYDLRVGSEGIATSTKNLVNLEQTGYLLLQPGDFAVVTVLEELKLGPQYAGRVGLRSSYARKGLIATTGPQVDPGFHGRLIVGVTNLTPNVISLPFKDDFVTIEFHRLERATSKPYQGPYQGRLHLGPEEMSAVTEGTGMAFSEVLTTLRSLNQNVSSLAESVATLKGEMSSLRTLVPLIVGGGIAIITVIVSILLFVFRPAA